MLNMPCILTGKFSIIQHEIKILLWLGNEVCYYPVYNEKFQYNMNKKIKFKKCKLVYTYTSSVSR